MLRRSFRQGLGEQAAEERAIHLHHVWQVEIEHVTDGFLHRGMVSSNVEDAVAAEKIEIGVVIHVVEISAFRSSVDFVEADDALRRDQGAVEMPLVEFVVLAQPGGYDLLQVNCHRECSAICRGNATAPERLSTAGDYRFRPGQLRSCHPLR